MSIRSAGEGNYASGDIGEEGLRFDRKVMKSSAKLPKRKDIGEPEDLKNLNNRSGETPTGGSNKRNSRRKSTGWETKIGRFIIGRRHPSNAHGPRENSNLASKFQKGKQLVPLGKRRGRRLRRDDVTNATPSVPDTRETSGSAVGALIGAIVDLPCMAYDPALSFVIGISRASLGGSSWQRMPLEIVLEWFMDPSHPLEEWRVPMPPELTEGGSLVEKAWILVRAIIRVRKQQEGLIGTKEKKREDSEGKKSLRMSDARELIELLRQEIAYAKKATELFNRFGPNFSSSFFVNGVILTMGQMAMAEQPELVQKAAAVEIMEDQMMLQVENLDLSSRESLLMEATEFCLEAYELAFDVPHWTVQGLERLLSKLKVVTQRLVGMDSEHIGGIRNLWKKVAEKTEARARFYGRIGYFDRNNKERAALLAEVGAKAVEEIDPRKAMELRRLARNYWADLGDSIPGRVWSRERYWDTTDPQLQEETGECENRETVMATDERVQSFFQSNG